MRVPRVRFNKYHPHLRRVTQPMPRRLYIVRHARAGERGDPEWPDDSQRPLTDEGRQRFACALKVLVKKHGFHPELVATSPYVRCRQTADLVVAALKAPPRLVERRELEPGSDLTGIIAWSNAQRASAIAWVGHAPDVLTMAEELAPDWDEDKFAKGAVAALDFPRDIAPAAGTLAWYLTAKSLGC